MSKVLGIIGDFEPASAGRLLHALDSKLRRIKPGKRTEVLAHFCTGYPNGGFLLEQKTVNPVEEIAKTARIMHKVGASYLAIPCIEAHYYARTIRDKIPIPVIDALEETDKYIKSTYGKERILGILAVSQAVQTDMFKEYFRDYRLLCPPGEIQSNLVMKAIESSRYSHAEDSQAYARKLLKHAAGYLIYMGVQVLVAGSAEISAVLRQEHVGICIIDPLEVLTDRLAEIMTM